MDLTLKIIEKYNLPKNNYKPDYDDAGYEFTLPSGIVVAGFFMLNGAPCEMEALEGLDGCIYISTEEELQEFISMSYEDTLKKIEKENKDFDINKYLDE